jgi:hypothetical protein
MARAARATATYLSNVFFAVNGADYFGPRVELNPMLHTWSLAVEEQFYVFWPLLIVLALWHRSRAVLSAVLAAVTIASLAICVVSTVGGGTFAFYQLPARAWEFSLGGLAALVPIAHFRRNVVAWRVAGWLGLAAVLISTAAIDREALFPGWIAIIPVAGTCAALIAGGEQSRGAVGSVLAMRGLQRLGTLSYSWYLWHWPILVFAAVLFPAISPVARMGAALAALVLADLTHRVIENPVRFSPALVARPALSVAMGLAVSAMTLVVSMYALSFSRDLAQSPKMRLLSQAASDIATIDRAACVTPVQSAELKTCVAGEESSPVHLVLFGDSHAIQWFNPIAEIVASRHWKLTTVFKSGCAAVDASDAPDAPVCHRWREAALRAIADLRPSLVILGSATNRLASPSAEYLTRVRSATRRTVDNLSDPRIPMVIIRDTPRFPFDVPTCLARMERLSWYPADSCQMPLAAALRDSIFAAEQSGVEHVDTVTFLDVTNRLCHDGICPPSTNGQPMYRDDNHLTGTFASSLRPAVEDVLGKVVRTDARPRSAEGQPTDVSSGPAGPVRIGLSVPH